MASSINASTTAGVVTTADTSAILQLQTAGTTALTVDTTTNVGIGTSSPAQTLHVKTSTSATPITLGVLSNATGLPALSFNGAYASTTMAGIYGNGATASSLYYEVPSGQSHFFGIADATKITINSSGNLQTIGTISVGNATPSTSGAGITFPATQSASTDANTLDDYEEGTWTPTIVRESTALGAVTYTAQDGKYTKIGRVVYITCSVAWSNIASAGAGANRIDGLPFSSGVSQTNGGATFYSSDGIATNPVLAGLFYNSTIYLRKSANILAVSNLNEAYNNSGTFSFNGYYFV